jgi:hypothetical protein
VQPTRSTDAWNTPVSTVPWLDSHEMNIGEVPPLSAEEVEKLKKDVEERLKVPAAPSPTPEAVLKGLR